MLWDLILSVVGVGRATSKSVDKELRAWLVGCTSKEKSTVMDLRPLAIYLLIWKKRNWGIFAILRDLIKFRDSCLVNLNFGYISGIIFLDPVDSLPCKSYC